MSKWTSLLVLALAPFAAEAVTYSVSMDGNARASMEVREDKSLGKILLSCWKQLGKPASCQAEIPAGTPVKLIVKTLDNAALDLLGPGTGDWSGCSAKDQPWTFECTATVSQASAIKSTVNLRKVLKIYTQGYGSGDVRVTYGDGTEIFKCPIQPPQMCWGKALVNVPITITERPAATSTAVVFGSGTGDAVACNGKLGSCTYTVTQDSVLYAPFASGNLLTVGTTGTGSGSVRLNGPSGAAYTVTSPNTTTLEYPANVQVRMDASFVTGSLFGGWQVVSGNLPTGACDNASRSCTFTVNGSIFIKAAFTTP